MATITKTPAGTWKAIIRKLGWPSTIKTFRTKKDARDWARRVEDEMVRGGYIDRSPAERMTLSDAVLRYLTEITPTKGKGAATREKITAKPILERLGSFSLAALTPQLIAEYRDFRLSTPSANTGKMLSGNTVRLELALISHLFTVAIQEWGIGLPQNPVSLIRKPKKPRPRDQRITKKEEKKLVEDAASTQTQCCFGSLFWRLRLE
ncbi:MAG: hypothetical protein L0Y39_01150 [Methylococcaceae bacterium]|nr:hypothetical protein [Methylococcaceae bacterium]